MVRKSFLGFVMLFIVVLFSGCSLLQFPQLNAPKPPEQIYDYHTSIEKQPQVVQVADGKSVVWESQKQTVDVGYSKKQEPLSWWQRFCNWLANWSILGIVGLGIALFVAPAATIAWLKAEADKFKTAFTQTVKGLDKSEVVKNSPAVAAALSSAQDASTKALVDDIQQPGK